MRIRNPILIAAAVLMMVAVVAAGRWYAFFSGTPEASESPAASPSPWISAPPAVETPSPAGTRSPAPSPRLEVLRGRLIDAYADQKILTVQLTDGKEEIVSAQNGLPEGLAAGGELRLSGRWDTQNGIFIADALTPLATGTLEFRTSLDDIKHRQTYADTLFTKAITLEFGKALLKPKPFYLVIMDPMGRILTPFRNDIPSASYTVEGSVATLQESLEATQRIRIGDMALGVWTVKLVILPGADMSTIFGFDPGLAPQSLSELAGKLWYFSIAKR
jgi:hypothetical protein